MRHFSMLLLALCFFACGADIEPTTTNGSTGESAVAETDAINPGLLNGFPTGIIESGCDCSLKLADDSDGSFFFVFDQQGKGTGQLRINDRDVIVQSGASLRTQNDNYDSYLHQNDEWTIKTSLTRNDEDGGSYTGKVKIDNRRTGVKTEVRVKGLCAC